MSRVVEQANDWLIQAMVVPQSTHGIRCKIQAARLQSGQCNPAHYEDAQYVPMGEDEHVAVERTNLVSPCRTR